jgi:hypothetical protein
VGLDATVAKVRLHFDRGVRLPVRPRSRRANQLVVDNVEELRRELMREAGRRKLSNQEDRCDNE